MSDQGSDLLTVTVTATGLSVAGEIDGHTSPRLASALAGTAAQSIAIDMSGVEFVDSSGLRVLIDAHQNSEREGGSLTLVNPSRSVTRLLEISGVAEYLRVAEA